ncbi:MAG: hypothetical protein CMJ05_11035 [Pelagibacterales bacterium]|nr:hypothetical protein [Pelagibacterales bacterium]
MENKMTFLKCKYYLITTIFLFSNIHAANSDNKITSLKELLKEENLKSEVGKLHYLANFSLRCGSLFEAINEVTPNINILNAAINLQRGASITAIMIKKNNPDQIDQEIQNLITKVVINYRNLININKDTNGEYIKGSNLLADDLEICKKFIPRAYRFLGNNGFKLKK